MRLLRSDLLRGFPHGFTTRQGGVSPAPWDALNLGGAVGDAPARVAENWRRLGEATGLAFARVHQVHGAAVVRLDAPTAPPGAAGTAPPPPEADAVLSTASGVAACVSVADCVPILLADPASGAVAAVHAGWRGTLVRAAAAAVGALAREVGAAPAALLAAVGPSIGPCCYAISPDLAARFAAELGPDLCAGPADAPRLDLWTANLRVLGAAGVPAERVDLLRRCTSCEAEAFFSHRRDRGRTGRQVAFIAPLDPTAGGALP